jgi:hypothetical protein
MKPPPYGRSWFFGVIFVCLAPEADCQSVSIEEVPPKLPSGLSLGDYSPPVEFGYSGLGTGVFVLKAWLLAPGPWLHASNEWNERVFTIDNSDGDNDSGRTVVVDDMGVFDYSQFAWVIRLYSGNTQLAMDEVHCDATSNRPPVLSSIGDKVVAKGETLSFTVAVSDPDGGSQILGASNLPSGASFNSATGEFSWTPDVAGEFPGIRFTATDSGDGPLTDAEEITISVVDLPVFKEQPQPLILEPGGSGMISALAEASPVAGPVSYQWFKDGVPLPGETGGSLFLSNVGESDGGTYEVVASNSVGNVTSFDAFVIVADPRGNEETRQRLLEYLKSVQDEFHEAYEVYREADSPGNHFHARGFIPDENALVTTDGAWSMNPHSAPTCMKFTFERAADGLNGGGIYLMNGALVNGAPVPYFGEDQLGEGAEIIHFVDSALVDESNERSFRGVDVSGATRLVFWARGESGGEEVEFFVGGVGWGTSPQPHPDSTDRIPEPGNRTTLTDSWVRYEIDLSGVDLSDIKDGFGWYAETTHNLDPLTTFFVDDVAFELSPEARQERLDEPRLMRSFSTLPVQPEWSLGEDLPFDLAFRSTGSIYDQVIAMLAFLSSDTSDGLRRARLIADALVYTAHHHRNPHLPGESRLRGFSKFYKVGDLALPPGWEIDGRAGTVPAAGIYDEESQSYTELEESNVIDTGENLWVIIGLLAVHDRVPDPAYLETALIAAEQVDAQRRDSGTYEGFIAGPKAINSPLQEPRTYRSLEHHLDAVAAFRKLHAVTGDPRWLENANHALVFVEQMWDESRSCYLTGTTAEPDLELNTDVIPQDAQSWAVLAIPEVIAWHPEVLDCVDTFHKVPVSGFDAYDFADDRDGFWPEGQGHLACAHHAAGDRQRSVELLSLLPRLQQMPPPHGDGNGIVSASHDFLSSGFGFKWFRRMHVGATGWAYMALQRFNPFTGEAMLEPARIGGVTRTDSNTVEVIFDGELGESYRIEGSLNLDDWQELGTIRLESTPTSRSYPMSTPSGFVRVRHLPDDE